MKIDKNIKITYINDVPSGQVFLYAHDCYEPIYAMKINCEDNDELNAVDLESGELFGVDPVEPLVLIDCKLSFV